MVDATDSAGAWEVSEDEAESDVAGENSDPEGVEGSVDPLDSTVEGASDSDPDDGEGSLLEVTSSVASSESVEAEDDWEDSVETADGA